MKESSVNHVGHLTIVLRTFLNKGVLEDLGRHCNPDSASRRVPGSDPSRVVHRRVRQYNHNMGVSQN